MSTRRLPTSVRVGCFDYAIEEWSPHLAATAQRLAECDRDNLVIRVRSDLPRQRIAEAVLHEILHAAFDAGACEVGDEERIVGVLGGMLAQVWRDNPEIVSYLSAALR